MSILSVKKKLPSNQKQIIEQSKITYSLLGKAFEKQIKTIEDQGKEQVDALKDLKSNKQKQAKQLKINLMISLQCKKKILIGY